MKFTSFHCDCGNENANVSNETTGLNDAWSVNAFC